MFEINLVYDAQAQLGEGPVWDPINARLYWVDILASRIHICDPCHPLASSYIEVGPFVSSVIPRQSGGLVLTLQDGFYALDPESAELTLLAKVEGPELGNRMNDGKCDPTGRYLAGSMSLNDQAGNGSLYSLDVDHTVKTLVSEVNLSNGLAWTPDGTTFYFIDTPTRQVFAFDYDVATGSVSNRRVAITVPEAEGYPDGMTIDSEGMLWIAHWGGWQVTRWNPTTGEKLLSVPVLASQVTSCTFGGPELDELYITTARVGLDTEQLAAQPHAGGLFRVKVGVTGLPVERFRG